jgi:hypothetical protein
MAKLGASNILTINEDSKELKVQADAIFSGETPDNYMQWNSSADRLDIYTTGSGATLSGIKLFHTDADANAGPKITMRRISNDAVNDILGNIAFTGDDDAGAELTYSAVRGQVGASAGSMAAGAEEGALNLIVTANGTQRSGILLKGTGSDTIDANIGYGAASKTKVAGYFAANNVTPIAAPTYTATSQTARNADTATADEAIQDVLQTLIADLIATGILQSS